MSFIPNMIFGFSVVLALHLAGLDVDKKPVQWVACVLILCTGAAVYKVFGG